ncbi:hypothetical protein DB88DRAFT_490942 [Papiliotrema laurentii]|uniref:Integral membrane protein n=1 Tax=Papiliotrema laurentii TaxID=5418 RepID=A0AAD9CZM1_PAPLA|nr:hypothetical protein DB88DRAFT_490942 [Papiliotrema laurentii]
MGGSVSSLLDPNKGRGGIVVPAGYTTPSFPSLYPPSLENTEDERGVFLYEAESIWRFTLYWTLILLGGTFFLCALWASFNLIISLTYLHPKAARSTSRESKLKPLHPPDNGRIKRKKRKRPPIWPLLVLPFLMLAVAALVALISGSVIGFALAAVYSAGGFTMSTWVPFLWALIQVLVLIISSYSTLTSIL